MALTVSFHGACGVVTGSCFEVRTRRGAVLIDCGMFQGTKTVKELNYGPFPFTPGDITCVLLTHSHIDHCGLLPKLVATGYAGPIVCTEQTADLLSYVLPDSGYIQEMEVEQLNRRNRRRGREVVEPIYTRENAEACLRHVIPRPYGKWIDAAPGIRARYWNAGHILGSSSIELEVREKDDTKARPVSLLFSGDIGAGDKAFHEDPQGPQGIDYVFMEATYGDRVRPRRTLTQRRTLLRNELRAALKTGGMILIPAFAIERTQELLVDLDELARAKEIPKIPTFVDSPLATRATAVFAKHLYGTRARGPHPFERAGLRYVETVEESKNLARLRGGAIIMAGSGMCDAGRIRHHLKNNLSRSDTTVLLVGYQAPGSLGRLLKDGASLVRIQGEEIAVAARIRTLDEYSGHADQARLVKWLAARGPIAQNIFLVHGEDEARQTLATVLSESGIPRKRIHIPALGETTRLTPTGAKTLRVRARVPEEAQTSDWHNTYAATVLALRAQLNALGSDDARERLLENVRRNLERKAR